MQTYEGVLSPLLIRQHEMAVKDSIVPPYDRQQVTSASHTTLTMSYLLLQYLINEVNKIKRNHIIYNNERKLESIGKFTRLFYNISQLLLSNNERQAISTKAIFVSDIKNDKT